MLHPAAAPGSWVSLSVRLTSTVADGTPVTSITTQYLVLRLRSMPPPGAVYRAACAPVASVGVFSFATTAPGRLAAEFRWMLTVWAGTAPERARAMSTWVTL